MVSSQRQRVEQALRHMPGEDPEIRSQFSLQNCWTNLDYKQQYHKKNPSGVFFCPLLSPTSVSSLGQSTSVLSQPAALFCALWGQTGLRQLCPVPVWFSVMFRLWSPAHSASPRDPAAVATSSTANCANCCSSSIRMKIIAQHVSADRVVCYHCNS